MDIHSKAVRSYNMSQVKSKNTKPELFVCEILSALKISFEKHYKTYGTPDIAFPDKKIAVFISGEFWHGRRYNQEKEKYQEFWAEKIKANMKRDRKNIRLLKIEGWEIIRIWDKDLKKHSVRELNKIMRAISHASVSISDLEV
jgi:DNA mismatch endonuclease, patch repair protein